ncbi:MAG: PP2C family protein-serine/threonine phosphatase [Phycisphaerales bacterium]
MKHADRQPDPGLGHLLLDCDMVDVQLLELHGGHAAVFSSRSPIKQTPNEDAAAVLGFHTSGGTLVIADGMGGVRGGEQASAAAIASVQSALAHSQGAARSAILDGIERANAAVLDLGIGAGTTLVAVEIDRDYARPYHVGDSQVLLVSQRGRIKHCTIAHAPVAMAVEAGMIDSFDAMRHRDRHLVSNYVGSPDMRIEIGPRMQIAPRDTLVLGTDGLFDNLHMDEIARIVRKGSLHDAATSLARAARQRMDEADPLLPHKPDDLTFVMFRLKD